MRHSFSYRFTHLVTGPFPFEYWTWTGKSGAHAWSRPNALSATMKIAFPRHTITGSPTDVRARYDDAIAHLPRGVRTTITGIRDNDNGSIDLGTIACVQDVDLTEDECPFWFEPPEPQPLWEKLLVDDPF
jgi:hypothetical protein